MDILSREPVRLRLRVHFRLQLSDLVNAALVASARKLCAEKIADDFDGQGVVHNTPAQRENVGVIMLARHPRGYCIVSHGGANSRNLVRSDGNANPRSAGENSQLV